MVYFDIEWHILCMCVSMCECDSAALPWCNSTCSSLLIDRCCHPPLNVVNMS